VFGTTSAAGWTTGAPPVTAGGTTSLPLPPELLLPEGSTAMTTPITAPTTTTTDPMMIRLRRRSARRCWARIWAIFSWALCLFLAPFDISIRPFAAVVASVGAVTDGALTLAGA
jgi:hypothetical protein